MEQGISETSIKEIAKKAGVSQGAMYNHYESKEELAWSIFAEHFSEIGMSLRHIIQKAESLEERVPRIVRYAFSLYDEDWQIVAYVFFPRYHYVKKVTPAMPNPHMVVRTMIAEAIANGEMPRKDPELAASMFLGAIIQTAETKTLGRIRGNLTDMTESVARACLGLLKA